MYRGSQRLGRGALWGWPPRFDPSASRARMPGSGHLPRTLVSCTASCRARSKPSSQGNTKFYWGHDGREFDEFAECFRFLKPRSEE